MSVAAPSAGADVAPVWRMLVAQTRALLLNAIRIPAFSVTSLALPVMFWFFFGLPNAGLHFPDGTKVGAYIMGSFGAYAVSSVMVFNFGIGVATSRAQKLDVLQRATPLPPSVAIIANILNALAFALVALVVLFVVAAITGDVRLPADKWVAMTFWLLVGALPLIGLGMTIGYSTGPNAAPAVVNLVYLPMSFASGLFIPLSQMPDFIQKIGPYLPTYHYGQLAWLQTGHADEPLWKAVLWLGAWGVVLLGLAIRAYRAEARRKFS